MKNPLQKKYLKHVKWPVVVGGYAFVLKTLGNVVAQRDAEKQRADVISAMFGSLVEFVGTDTYTAWEARMSELYPIDEGMPEKPATEPPPAETAEPVLSESGEDPAFNPSGLPTPVTTEELDDDDSIEIAAPIDAVEIADNEAIDIPGEVTDGEESSEEASDSEEESSAGQSSERGEP